MGIKETLTETTTKASSKLSRKIGQTADSVQRGGSTASAKGARLAKLAKRDARRAEQAARRQADRELRGQGIAAKVNAAGSEISDNSLTAEEEEMFLRAEGSARMGAPIQDAKLAPLDAPQETAALAGGAGEMTADSLLVGNSGDDDGGFFQTGDDDGGFYETGDDADDPLAIDSPFFGGDR